MTWLVCPEDDFMTEVSEDDPDASLSEVAEHIADAHDTATVDEFNKMLADVEEID